MATYTRSPSVPYPALRESVRLAALAIVAEGESPTDGRLRARGVKGNTGRISEAIADLVKAKILPVSCRRSYRQVRVRHVGAEPAGKPPRVHRWATLESYWTPARRALYRKGV